MARILLADDEAGTRDLVKRALAADGHSVVAAQDGQEALEHLMAKPGSFDLLISDVEMPLLDGIALAIQARSVVPGLRVLLMSGFAHGQDKVASMPAPTPRLVTKPFSLEKIRAEVKAALG